MLCWGSRILMPSISEVFMGWKSADSRLFCRFIDSSSWIFSFSKWIGAFGCDTFVLICAPFIAWLSIWMWSVDSLECCPTTISLKFWVLRWSPSTNWLWGIGVIWCEEVLSSFIGDWPISAMCVSLMSIVFDWFIFASFDRKDCNLEDRDDIL